MAMEFEELKVEIPVDDGEKEEKDFPFNMERRYENKSGCFVTGFDVTSKEALERKARRAKRFGLQKKNKDADNKSEGQSDKETDAVWLSIDVKDLPAISEGEARLDAILIHGVDDMSTKDVFAYFNDFAPGSVEWIDDSSCNVVWDDDFSASRVLMAIGKEIEGHGAADDEISDTQEVRWKIGPSHPKAKCLLLRLATKKDKKRPGAAQRSMYYLINGNPNVNSNKGLKKGLVSSSRKRKIQKEKERVKHMYDDGPDVLFLDKIEAEEEEKMEIDEPPLKIVVTNDGQAERSDSSNLRMRMYADSVEDDESESDEDDDRRERRDKWKGRIERREEKKEEPKPQPPLDLRSKLESRERHGFNFKNRPSLSIEIKEEPES